MADPSTEDLEALLDVADTDAAIRRNRVTLADLPEQQQLAQLDDQVEELQRQRADQRLLRDDVTAVAGKHDRDVAQLRERLAEEQQRMYAGNITNAKEYSKLEAEIGSVQDKIDAHEEAELEALEEMDAHDTTIADIDRQLAELATSRATVEAARDEAAAGLLAEIAELEVARDRRRDGLADELLVRYDESAQRHRGNAIGRLDGERCTACGIGLSYADVNELHDGPPLTTCPSCGRLMVVA